MDNLFLVPLVLGVLLLGLIAVPFLRRPDSLLYRFFRWYNRNSKKENLEFITCKDIVIGKHRIKTSIIYKEELPYIRVTLISDNILPVPLEIVKTSGVFHGRGKEKSLRLSNEEIPAINRILGRNVLSDEIIESVNALAKYRLGFSIFDHRITLLLDSEARMENVYPCADLLARTASLLQTARAAADLRFPAALHAVRHAADSLQRIEAFHILRRYYSDRAETRGLPEELARDADFDVAYEAAAVLGLDLERVACARITDRDPDNACKAVKRLGMHPTSSGCDFLYTNYHGLKSKIIKNEILRSLRHYGDPRSEIWLSRELASGAAPLKLAAAETLAFCGGRDSLEALYTASTDRRSSAALRRAASLALAAIRERLGLSGSGFLSLPARPAARGELSLSQEEKGPRAPDLD